MKITLFLLFTIIIISACNKDKFFFNADTNISINREEINRKVLYNASMYVEDVQYIPLETDERFLIGEIRKLILSSNYIHIHDSQTNNLYQFDYDGKFIRKIGKKGKGPNEYTKISTFSIEKETGNIAIYCEIKQSILEFTSEGKFVEEKKVGFVCSDFIHYDGGYMFYGGRYPNQNIFNDIFPNQYRMIKINNNNEIVEKYLYSKFNALLLNTIYTYEKNSLYYTNDNKLNLVESPNGLIYKINSELKPNYSIDFGKHTIPIIFFYNKNISEKVIKNINKSDICYLSSFIEINDYIYITYVINKYNRMHTNSIYIKKNNELFNLGPLWVNDIDKIGMPSILTSYNNSFVGYYKAHGLKLMIDTNENKLSNNIIELGKSLNDIDNPIICIINMKKVK